MNRDAAITVDRARAYVQEWRQSFPRAPASVCLTLMEIESDFFPAAHAPPTAEAVARGVHPAGAWGLLQLLHPTAADMVRKIRRLASVPPGMPRAVLDALTVWDDGHPECLSDPALGSLLGVAYLDHLAERFGPELEMLAAAYHNGAGFLRDFLDAGKQIPEDMPPRGKEYVYRARRAARKYEADDATPPVMLKGKPPHE